MSDGALRIIQVGVGTRGETWLRILAANPAFELVGLVDVQPRYLERGREITGLGPESCFESLSDAIAATDADAVMVCSPARFHADFLTEALAVDLHVLVEKPLTVGLDDARQCVTIALNRGMRLMVVQNHRYEAGNRAMRRVLASGELGAPGFAVQTHHKARGGPYPTSRNMHLWQQGVHQLDNLIYVLDRQPLRARGCLVAPEWEDWPSAGGCSAVIEFEGGVIGTYFGTSNARAKDLQLRVDCEHGAVIYRNGAVTVVRNGVESPLAPEPPIEPSVEDLLARQFYDYVVRDIEPPTSGRRNLAVIGLLEAIERSAETGAAVEVSR
jgi:predicted dehydrogenase